MAMSAPTSPYYTAAMVRALPDDGHRHELVAGELLVSPAPRAWHQELVRRLIFALSAYLERTRAGHLFASPADVSWDESTLVQPDLFVVPLEEARTLDWSRIRSLLFAIEVLSPSTAHADRFTKRLEYQRRGIGAYWVVDGEEHRVEVWAPGDLFPRIEQARVSWRPGAGGEEFTLELDDFFRPI